MKIHKLLIFPLIALAASCSRGQYDFVGFDFRGNEAVEGAFRATSMKETDLSHGLPENCPVPDCSEDTKTTSVTVNLLLSDLFEYNNKGKIIEISGEYESIDLNTFERTLLSGKVLLPKGRKPSRYIVVSHYTIGANNEAPSNLFPLEGVLCNMGYAMIFPDYRGYGVDSGHIHPYLMLEQTALDVYLMYQSVEKYLKGTEYEPVHDDIYLMGFSQGGAVTMGLQWLMEQDSEADGKIRQVFAGGGPYDVRETYNNFITTNTVHIAPAVPFVIQGMIYGNNLDIDKGELLQPWINDKVDEWINSKNYSMNQLRAMMGTTTTSDILTPKGMDPTSDEVAELYKAMSENSILAQNWSPKAPVYLFHSINDDVVPFVNAARAKSKWKDSNIQYNFGYYGSHQSATLRFIYTVKTWLKNEGE